MRTTARRSIAGQSARPLRSRRWPATTAAPPARSGQLVDQGTDVAGGLQAAGDGPQRVARLDDHRGRRRWGVGIGAGRVEGFGGRRRPGGGSVGAEERDRPEGGEGDEAGQGHTADEDEDQPADERTGRAAGAGRSAHPRPDGAGAGWGGPPGRSRGRSRTRMGRCGERGQLPWVSVSAGGVTVRRRSANARSSDRHRTTNTRTWSRRNPNGCLHRPTAVRYGFPYRRSPAPAGLDTPADHVTPPSHAATGRRPGGLP